jgi:outer membrane protein OmpA-like peptidoglycan-associated protein
MFGLKTLHRSANKDEAEKPFWISFSDLMTALMVLFLVAMAVALLSVTKKQAQLHQLEGNRTVAVESCVAKLQGLAEAFPGVVISGYSIDFGPLANFPNNSSALTQRQQEFLRRFVPRVLRVARQPVCQAWLKRVVVEGFASQSGTYLYNMDLSTKRSERVLCALLDKQATDPTSEADRRLIQSLFFVGGYSSSTIRKTAIESRRIELKLEFYALREAKEKPPAPPALDENTSCPIGAR